MARRERIGGRGAASFGVSLAAHLVLLVLAWTARPPPGAPHAGEAIEVRVLPAVAARSTAQAPAQARAARAPAPRGRAVRRAPGPSPRAGALAAAAPPLGAAAPEPGLAPAPGRGGPADVAFAGEALETGGLASFAGTGSGAGAETTAELDSSWLRKNQRSIERRIQREMDGTPYPHQARRMWWTGRVHVSFTLQPDGHVRDVRVVRSSGRPILDRCAVETVIDAAPYPRPPIDQEVEVPFEFRLVPM